MSDDFQAMQQSAFASVRGTSVGDVKYHVFGLIPVSEWDLNEFEISTTVRLNSLDIWFDTNTPAENICIMY